MHLRNAWLDALTTLGVVLHRQPLCGPRIVQLGISDECNLACAMCNRQAIGAGGLMPLATATRLVEELSPLGMREIFFHGFGEPCLNPDLPEMIRVTAARAPRVGQHIITNGTWMTDPLLAAIREVDVKVRVSAHGGDRASWKAVHPEDDERVFACVERTLRRLADGRPDRVEVLFVLTNLNAGRVDVMAEFAAACGVRHVLFRPMRLFPDAQGHDMNRHLMLSGDQYDRVRRDIGTVSDRYRGRLEIQSVPFSENRFDPALGRPSSRDFYKTHRCYIGSVLTVISTNGDVWGCVEESTGGAPLGNINRESFREIWWGPAYRRFREQQLFRDKAGMSADGCHTFCQHLGINRTLNDVRQLRWHRLGASVRRR